MSKITAKNKSSILLTTDQLDVVLSRNKKYISGNIISRWLIRGFMQTLVNLASQVTPNTILEAGCGEGIVLRQLNALWPKATFHGIDIAVEQIQVCKDLLPNSLAVQASVYQLPLPEKYYDLVICTEVLEHLVKPELALTELARVGKAYLLLSVPHEPWWRIANMARGHYLRQWGNTPKHVNHWSSRGFLDLLSTRIDVISVRHPFPWTMVLGRMR